MISSKDLERMSSQSIEAIPTEQLKSLSDVRIKTTAPQEEKVLSFIEQIGNPYCFLSGDTAVGVRFSENGKDINQALVRILQNVQQT